MKQLIIALLGFFIITEGYGQVSAKQQVLNDSLALYRKQINMIDTSIISLLSDRMNIASKIGIIKKRNNEQIEQPGRWQEVLNRIKSQAVKRSLDTSFVEEVYNLIHLESKRTQKKSN